MGGTDIDLLRLVGEQACKHRTGEQAIEQRLVVLVIGGAILRQDVVGDQRMAAPILNQLATEGRGEIEADGARGKFAHMAYLRRNLQRLENARVAFLRQRPLAAQAPEAAGGDNREGLIQRHPEHGAAVEPEQQSRMIPCRVADDHRLPGIAALGELQVGWVFGKREEP